MPNNQDGTRRQLTHNELKAAEAAFQGWEFNDAWSAAALSVYIGIRLAKMKLNHERLRRGERDADRHPFAAAEHHRAVLA